MNHRELRARQEGERRSALAGLIELDAFRRCVGQSHIDSAAALRDAIEGLTRRMERHAEAALAEGESYAEVARAVRMTRQGARKRYGHLEVVS